MAVTITGLDRELAAVLDEVSSTLRKSRAQIANNIGSQVAQKASSGRTRYTPAATSAQVRADLNRPVGKWGRAIFRAKHALAVKSLKGQGQTVSWQAVKQEAKRIERIKQASRSFLRAGWLWPAYSLGVEAQKFKKGGDRNARGFTRGGVSQFGPKSIKSRRFSSARPATNGNPVATIENLAAEVTAKRRVPDYTAAVFKRGSPSRFKGLGEQGLARAGKAQVEFEKRTLPRALESQALRAMKRGEKKAASVRKLGRTLL